MVSIWIISLGHSILKLILSASNCLLDLAGVPDKLIAVAPLTCGNPWISLGISPHCKNICQNTWQKNADICFPV